MEKQYKFLTLRLSAALWKQAMLAKIEGRIKSITHACIEGLEERVGKKKKEAGEEAGD